MEAKQTVEMLKRDCFRYEFEFGCKGEDCKYCYVASAIDTLEKNEKYRWHDLRKDPGDLPEEDREVIVITEGKVRDDNTRQRVGWLYNDGWIYSGGYYGTVDEGYVIAWREIEPFEEEA